MSERLDSFGARGTFDTGSGEAVIYRLSKLQEQGIGNIETLPFSIKIMLENALRHVDGMQVTEQDVRNIASWDAANYKAIEIPFKPARVILQDFTGVACAVDLASLRSAMVRLNGDAARINPIVPVDLVIDHSVQVDVFGRRDAVWRNSIIEFDRNRERYEFLHWAQKVFNNFKVVPPATGIVHQVNLEYLAKVVQIYDDPQGGKVVLPDTVVGTDSHTTMINGLGVVGWGVGGIEAEAAMLGQPIYMLMPQVVGFKLTGALREGTTATDLVLVITQILRQKGVVDKFVEFFGPGLSTVSLQDRATIANMAPEYGATIGFFPVDQETLSFLWRTGRDTSMIQAVERYSKEQGLFRTDDMPDPLYNEVVELDLSTVEPSMAGPSRPQDRILLRDMKEAFTQALRAPVGPSGFDLKDEQLKSTAIIRDNGSSTELHHGAVVIAAITSCTNTSNPSAMISAGIVAKKAVERGLNVKPYVKTSLAPGSKVVTEYLDSANLTPYLEALGFHTVGYGCTTCIGNSGPLPEAVTQAINEGDLVATSVLSGNRNFSGRINPEVRANYLASPALVVAYALAGTVDIDLINDPIGKDPNGEMVYLKDIWPTQQEILDTIQHHINPEMYDRQYANVYTGNEMWNAIPSPSEPVYRWDEKSTYIQEPPFFQNMSTDPKAVFPITGARVLGMFGDSVTTDHISPAGDIAEDSPAGQYLKALGVEKKDFNTYGTRRGNDRIMTRGTFANVRLRNRLVAGSEGNITYFLPTMETMSFYDAGQKYIQHQIPLVIIAGKDYGMGSSRDWAAKGTFLLGVKAVIAESFERIHRSNLVMMGVLPLTFEQGQGWSSLGLTGQETFEIPITEDIQPMQKLQITATDKEGNKKVFSATARLNSPVEIEYYKNGGILQTILRGFMRS